MAKCTRSGKAFLRAMLGRHSRLLAEKTRETRGRIVSHWPTAPVLHITQDPQDVYASMIESEKWDRAGTVRDTVVRDCRRRAALARGARR